MANPMGLVDARSMMNQHLSSMAELERLIAQLLNQDAAQVFMLGVSDGAPGLVITKDFPFQGATRALITRTPQKPHDIPAAASGILYDVNVNRLGGSIVNKAAAGLTLILSDQATRSGAGSIWLAPNGGTWDFKLSDAVWCGNVFAVPDSGNVNVAGAEM